MNIPTLRSLIGPEDPCALTNPHEITVGSADLVETRLFSRIDYVAPGHLRPPQNVDSERILLHAYRRMKALFRGQYELVRQVDADNRRCQTCLEQDMRNWPNSTVRSVRGYSGGEAFLASLSLALGMSDMIQARRSISLFRGWAKLCGWSE